MFGFMTYVCLYIKVKQSTDIAYINLDQMYVFLSFKKYRKRLEF